MTARLATASDAHRTARLLLDFHEASGLPFETSAAWALALFQSHLNNPDSVVIVKDGGVLIGAVGPSQLGPFKIAQEIAWWVDPAHRGGSLDMLSMYEAWALTKGAKFIEAKSLARFPETERLYRAKGYVQCETSWIK